MTSKRKIFIGRFIHLHFDVKARKFFFLYWMELFNNFKNHSLLFLFCFRQFQVTLSRKMLSLRRTIFIGMFIQFAYGYERIFFFSSLNGSFQSYYEPFWVVFFFLLLRLGLVLPLIRLFYCLLPKLGPDGETVW